jgi:CubicO group peptidase (beta-lactamase class C family)
LKALKSRTNSLSRRQAVRVLAGSSLATSLSGRNYDEDSRILRRTPVQFRSVQDYILQAISRGEATGVAAAVVHNGRIIWEEGFGWANRETGLKVTPRTPFSLASITKPFTTTMLTTLAAEGRLSLDDPANEHLSKNKIQGLNKDLTDATIRRLGAHASGLPTMFEGFFRNEAALAPSPETLLKNYGRLAYPPGLIYEYSNIGFAALGAIATKLTGTEFGTLMTERVLKPLGLSDSFFDTDIHRLLSSAVRYDGSGQPIPYYTTSTPASGELYVSAHDLARFALFSLEYEVPGQAQILNRKWIRELQRPVFTGPSGVATTFGWFAANLRSGHRVVFETGGQPGVATLIYMIPSERFACLALSNRSNGQDLTHNICRQIMSTYISEAALPLEDAGPNLSPFAASSDFVGSWERHLTNDGTNSPVRLQIASGKSASVAISHQPAEAITDVRSAAAAFTGTATGVIDAADAIRTNARALHIKLIPHEGRLVGRILATAGNPDKMNSMLPYVLSLDRRA